MEIPIKLPMCELTPFLTPHLFSWNCHLLLPFFLRFAPWKVPTSPSVRGGWHFNCGMRGFVARPPFVRPSEGPRELSRPRLSPGEFRVDLEDLEDLGICEGKSMGKAWEKSESMEKPQKNHRKNHRKIHDKSPTVGFSWKVWQITEHPIWFPWKCLQYNLCWMLRWGIGGGIHSKKNWFMVLGIYRKLYLTRIFYWGYTTKISPMISGWMWLINVSQYVSWLLQLDVINTSLQFEVPRQIPPNQSINPPMVSVCGLIQIKQYQTIISRMTAGNMENPIEKFVLGKYHGWL